MHPTKHLNFAPTLAQSASVVHALLQLLPWTIQAPPCGVTAKSRHAKPDAHSASEAHPAPAGFGEDAPHAATSTRKPPANQDPTFILFVLSSEITKSVDAAGASEAWKSSHNTPELTNSASPANLGNVARVPDAALYQSGNPLALTAAEHSIGADSQLVRAVRGMETYYTSQLARRQSELRQLSGPGVAGMTADWQRELVSLDSSYRKLKQELPHHPQPDAVLTAMNRNLQIRLDILDQQLHLGTATEADPNSGAYVLADSRHQAE